MVGVRFHNTGHGYLRSRQKKGGTCPALFVEVKFSLPHALSSALARPIVGQCSNTYISRCSIILIPPVVIIGVASHVLAHKVVLVFK